MELKVYIDLQGPILTKDHKIVPNALDSLRELQSFSEIELIVLSDSMIESEELKLLGLNYLLKSNVNLNPDDILISETIKDSSRSFAFDYRNPRTSWKKALHFIKQYLKNSRELELYFSGMGPVYLINNSKVGIKKIILQSYTHQFFDEGYVHVSRDDDYFLNIPPGGEVIIKKHSGFNSESASIKICEWEDGQVVENITLTSD